MTVHLKPEERLDDLQVKGKRVLVRCDFNVPLNKETGEKIQVLYDATIKRPNRTSTFEGVAYYSLDKFDTPFVMGYNMFLAILTVIGTLLSDIMYSVVDPRVKLGK